MLVELLEIKAKEKRKKELKFEDQFNYLHYIYERKLNNVKYQSKKIDYLNQVIHQLHYNQL